MLIEISSLRPRLPQPDIYRFGHVIVSINRPGLESNFQKFGFRFVIDVFDDCRRHSEQCVPIITSN